MIIRDKVHGEFNVWLGDDGTLDTVIVVEHTERLSAPQEIRFGTEYAAHFRDDTGAITDIGFEELAQEAMEAYIEQYLI